jgi:hypothetical protein
MRADDIFILLLVAAFFGTVLTMAVQSRRNAARAAQAAPSDANASPQVDGSRATATAGDRPARRT